MISPDSSSGIDAALRCGDRGQSTLLPKCLDDFINESNPIRVVDAFGAAVDLGELGSDGVRPAVRPLRQYRRRVNPMLYRRVRIGRLEPPADKPEIGVPIEGPI
jgi:hypothetical protein